MIYTKQNEGPTLLPAKYTCSYCQHTRYRGGHSYWCNLLLDPDTQMSKIIIFNYETPVECPFLLKQTRKDKLKQIGNG